MRWCGTRSSAIRAVASKTYEEDIDFATVEAISRSMPSLPVPAQHRTGETTPSCLDHVTNKLVFGRRDSIATETEVRFSTHRDSTTRTSYDMTTVVWLESVCECNSRRQMFEG